MHRALLLLFFTLLLGTNTADARCAAPRLFVELVTPLTSPMPIGANLVVAVRSGHRQTGPQVERDVNGGFSITGFSLTQGDTHIALRAEVIGGGLARLVPERPLAAGTYQLVGFARTDMTNGAVLPYTQEVVVRGALPAAPTAIAVTSARATQRSEGETRWGERTRYTGTFRLSGPVPANLAAVALAGSNAWIVADATAGARELTVTGAFGGSHCGDGSVPGVTRPETGATVHLVLVNVYGRVVTSTANVTIR